VNLGLHKYLYKLNRDTKELPANKNVGRKSFGFAYPNQVYTTAKNVQNIGFFF
jgi:hypothetical protein